jgi:hypothetical protein
LLCVVCLVNDTGSDVLQICKACLDQEMEKEDAETEGLL